MAAYTGNKKGMGSSSRILSAFHEAVAESVEGFKGVASQLGKSDKSLYAELNPAPVKTSNAKLSVLDAISIMEITESIQPLRVIAAELGCRVLQVAADPGDTPPQEHLLDLDAAVLDFRRKWLRAHSYEDLIQAMRPIQDAMNALVVLRRMHDSGMTTTQAVYGMPLMRKGEQQ